MKKIRCDLDMRDCRAVVLQYTAVVKGEFLLLNPVLFRVTQESIIKTLLFQRGTEFDISEIKSDSFDSNMCM